jgi:hypothetical protein
VTPATLAREKLQREADVSRRNAPGISGFLADIIGTAVPAVGAVIAGVNTLLGARYESSMARAERRIETELATPLPMQSIATAPAPITGGEDMSMWGQLGTAIVGGWTSSIAARGARRAATASAAQPGSGQLLSSLTGLAGWGGAAAGVVTGGVSRAARWCSRNPGRCTIMGGLTAVEAYLSSTGKLPPNGRRSRGITGRELKSFKRVSRLISKYCAPTKRAMRSPALRGGKSCR